jgi:hypothetical protein
MRQIVFSVCVTTLFVLVTLRIVFGVGFSLGCSQYLKRASDANTIELAKANLNVAIKYAEMANLTNGIVSIFLQQPENDIGFWYSNLIASRDELSRVTTNTSQMEKSNLLMKLRETLTDNGKEGTQITCPNGISVYPYNKLFFWLIAISLFITIPLGFATITDL